MDPAPGRTESSLSEASPSPDGATWEQQRLLAHEEADWHKNVRKRAEDDKERVWLDEMVLDERIAERMRRFVLDASEESRAQRIAEGRGGLEAKDGDDDRI